MNKKAATKSNADLGNTEFQARWFQCDFFGASFPGQAVSEWLLWC